MDEGRDSIIKPNVHVAIWINVPVVLLNLDIIEPQYEFVSIWFINSYQYHPTSIYIYIYI